MKKLLLIIGIILIIACVLSVVYAMLNLSAYHSLFDGTAEHYAGLHRNAVIFSVAGIVLALIGAACLIISFKVL